MVWYSKCIYNSSVALFSAIMNLIRGGNGHGTCPIQIFRLLESITETKIVKMSDDPPLVNEQNGK